MMAEIRQIAKQTASRWLSAIPNTVGGLAVWYLNTTYRAKKYSAKRWRSAWRPVPEFWRSDPFESPRIRADRQTANRTGEVAE